MTPLTDIAPPLPTLEELCAEPLTARQREWLQQQGVPTRFIDADWRGLPAPIWRTHVAFSSDRRWFDPSPDGVTAFVVEVRDQFGEHADWAAWRPRSGSFATSIGALPMLGIENCFRPRVGELVIHASPLSWLVAGRSGVLLRDIPQAVDWLRDAGPLLFESREQAQAVRDASTIGNIFVMKQRRAA
jgi:hypothetical protein